ncbi:hypothetical protein RBEAN4_1324 [Rickettsia bellii str. RML An4]|uniref:Uncharacterized protein n=1 Tax=Rickettsia bellii str. RML An4 TaxID=1359193 RepID=A0A0F3QDT6_RICBE|nr:hypothetical protein RBEAN4_1324 [Rickettsia bellii str. RML An4]
MSFLAKSGNPSFLLSSRGVLLHRLKNVLYVIPAKAGIQKKSINTANF